MKRSSRKPQQVRIQRRGFRFQLFTGVVVAMLFATIVFQTVNQPTSASDAGTKIRLATYNVLISTSLNNVLSDVQSIIDTQNPDVLTLQELYSDSKRAKVMSKFACSNGCAYDGYSVNGRGKEELVILWKRDRYTPVYEGSIKTASGWTERGKYHGPLYFNFVRLQDVNVQSRQIIVATNHAPSLVDRDDDGRPNWKQLPKRVAAYKKHMQRVQGKISFWKSKLSNTPIFFTGDFNVNFRKDIKVKAKIFPYRTFKQVGGYSSWHTSNYPRKHSRAATFAPKPAIAGQPKNRLIDYIFKVDNGGNMGISSAWVYSGDLHSDHRAAIATYKYQ